MNRVKLAMCLTAFVFVTAGCGDKTAETQSEAVETTAETSEKASVDGETSEIEIEALYEDNFDVPEADAAAYADRIKTAVAEKDLEALAELIAFPVYVGLPDIGGVETRDDFLSLGAEQIFTDELVTSVTSADAEGLTASMAGFVLSDGSSANIIFGVVDGELAVTGINY